MSVKPITQNTLFYGDNLPILREYIPDESIDLVYLDPPFNSNRSYNVLFKDESGRASDAQLIAFDDSWHWGKTAEETYYEIITHSPLHISKLINAMREFIGTNQVMAYLAMMTARLVELHRVLKSTGSLYLHCDPTASHYLKIILDNIFGPQNFRNEIIWKRQSAHSGAKRWGDVHDILLFYSKSNLYTWVSTYQPYLEEYLKDKYRFEDHRGKYMTDNLTGAGITRGGSGQQWRGFNPAVIGRHWAIEKEIVEELVGPEQAAQMTSQEKLDLLDDHG